MTRAAGVGVISGAVRAEWARQKGEREAERVAMIDRLTEFDTQAAGTQEKKDTNGKVTPAEPGILTRAKKNKRSASPPRGSNALHDARAQSGQGLVAGQHGYRSGGDIGPAALRQIQPVALRRRAWLETGDQALQQARPVLGRQEQDFCFKVVHGCGHGAVGQGGRA